MQDRAYQKATKKVQVLQEILNHHKHITILVEYNENDSEGSHETKWMLNDTDIIENLREF
ncbi:hypothetical protein CU098_001695, partial [Rhizopus stolonifer]